MIMECDRADGVWDTLPQNHRKIQIDRLVAISHYFLKNDNTNTDDKLRQCLKDVPEGDLYFLATTTTDSRLQCVPNLLSIHLPEGVERNTLDWKTDYNVVQQADSALVDWLDTQFNLRHKSFKECHDRARFKFLELMSKKNSVLYQDFLNRLHRPAALNKVHGSRLNGSRVLLKTHRKGHINHVTLSLQWQHSDGTQKDIKNFFLPKDTLPLGPDDLRFIYFLREGVDIRDKSGRSLGTSETKAVTVPIFMLEALLTTNPLHDEFFALWERETGLSADEVMLDKPRRHVTQIPTQKMYPPEYFHGRKFGWDSQGRLTKSKVVAQLNSMLPFQPGDAIWLINKFLEEEYPNDPTEIDCCNPREWPELNSVWQKLNIWLYTPLYRNHPHCRGLKATAANIVHRQQRRNIVAYFHCILQVLYDVVTVETPQSSVGGRQRVRTVYTVAQKKSGICVQPVDSDLVSWSPDDEDAEDEDEAGDGDDSDVEMIDVGSSSIFPTVTSSGMQTQFDNNSEYNTGMDNDEENKDDEADDSDPPISASRRRVTQKDDDKEAEEEDSDPPISASRRRASNA